MKKILFILIIFCGELIAGIAYDDASSLAYDDGLQSNDNGGDGFEPWIISDSYTNNFIIASASTNGGWSATNNIDSAGKSFGIYNINNTDGFIEAWRYLTEDLEVGQTFSFSFDVNWRGGYKGIRVQDHDNESIFRVEVGNRGSGDSTWVDDVIGGAIEISSEYSDDTQYNVVLTQSTSSGGTWSVQRTGGTNDLDSGSYEGNPSHFQIYSYLASSQIYDTIFFNSFDVSYISDFDFYAAWIGEYGLSEEDKDLYSDPDNDFINNLREFALGGNPTNSDALNIQPSLIIDNDGLKYIYNRYVEEYADLYNINYNLKSAENLRVSDWTNRVFDIDIEAISDYLISVTNHIPLTNSYLFLDLDIDQE